jgi:glucosamine-6-phosphate deaminase
LKLTVLNDHPAIAVRAAQDIAQNIKTKADNHEHFNFGLATGSTMEPLYAELIRMHREEGLHFNHVHFFNLDNYIGLAHDDRNNYDVQLRQLFLNHIDANPEHIHLVSSDHDFHHDAYEAQIETLGGIDIQLVGLGGGSGHIAFNEYGSSLNSSTRQITLSQKTLEDNSRFFNQINKKTNRTETIPLTAHTRGLGPILKAKAIVCLVNGHNKAKALKAMFEHGTIESLPARALHHHANTMVLVDRDALALFDQQALDTHTDLNAEQKNQLFRSNQPYAVTVSINGEMHELLLPPHFDFYNPNTMQINEAFDPRNQAHLDDLAANLGAVTDVVIGAHPDDAEIMAGPMMLEKTSPWLTLIVTNGAATHNTLNGEYSQYTPEQLTRLRQMEQRQAADFARVPVIMCKFPTAAMTGDMGQATLQNVRITMRGLFGSMPNLTNVYGHNPFDDHDTHINVLAEQVNALRFLNTARLETIKIWGMEVWGTLHAATQRLLKIPVEHESTLEKWHEMISFYQSQIASQGRNYAITTVQRARGHAGYQTHPHGANPAPGLLLAMDLTDLVHQKSRSMHAMVETLMSELDAEVTQKTRRILRNRDNTDADLSSAPSLASISSLFSGTSMSDNDTKQAYMLNHTG